MTDDEITELRPAFARHLRRYRDCFLQERTATHFDNYTRGLLSDLPRKTVEPIALACGTAARRAYALRSCLRRTSYGDGIRKNRSLICRNPF